MPTRYNRNGIKSFLAYDEVTLTDAARKTTDEVVKQPNREVSQPARDQKWQG